jgi:glycosyltransferase involved in cell wall biosynthesis/SAM-dependent methyltransferase
VELSQRHFHEAEPDARPPERVISVHFPKAGGSSLHTQFAALIGDGLLLDYDHDPLTACGSDRARFPDGKRIVHGHFRADCYAGSPAYLMTFLREPVDNLISFYFYWLAEKTATHDVHARFLREQPSILEFANYPQIRRLMSETYFGDFDMERFDFIGFHESREADLARLAAILALPLVADVHENKTVASSQREALRTDDETIERLERLLADDIAFYWRARLRFGGLLSGDRRGASALSPFAAREHGRSAAPPGDSPPVDRLRRLEAAMVDHSASIAEAGRALVEANASAGVAADRARRIESDARAAVEARAALEGEAGRLRQQYVRQLARLKRPDYDGRLPGKLGGVKSWLPGRGRKFRRRAREYRAIAASPLFDGDWYLANNPGVAATRLDPVYHYLRYGGQEGRPTGPDFDGGAYVRANPDVAASGENPLLHFIRIGASEGRSTGIGSPPEGARALNDVSYREWVRHYDTLSDADRDAIAAHLKRLDYQPLISVVMPAYETPEAIFREAVDSIRAQLYTNWELCVIDDASPSPTVGAVLAEYAALDSRIKWKRRAQNGHISAASNTALELASGEFVALMDHDDVIPPHALYEMVAELNAHRDADILYSDEDKIDEYGRRYGPYFKTDWNPELFLGQNFINHLGVYRRSLVASVGGFRLGFEGSQDYDLTLRCVRATSPDKIRHIPAILYHWRKEAGGASFSDRNVERCVAAARKAKNEYLVAIGDAGHVVANPSLSYWERAIRPTPTPAPLVSLIVPTRNRADLLRPCLDGLMTQTSYQSIEIIVIDHQSDEPETLALLKRVSADPRVRITRYEGAFNYSAMNNRAVALARGELIGLINNDIEIIAPDWLSEMVGLALVPGAGAVGAKLLYPDGRLQHAGVGLGVGASGVAGHFYPHGDPDMVGYHGRLQLTSNVSAVTAACLIVKKAIFLEVGGLNETHLTVAFNDVDFCLKVREAGYRNVWTPHATLIHHESLSRGRDDTPITAPRFRREVEWMLKTWGYTLTKDPYLNPNLSLETGNFDLAFPPRRVKPWRAAAPFETSSSPSREVTSDLADWPEAPAATLVSADAETKPSDRSIPDAHVKEPPNGQLAFKLFEGEWSSIVPGYGGGRSDLFNDLRIKWFEAQCGGFQGKRILELGPLEGGHTYMMANAGAASVTAIESNTRAFLKCLVVQNALKFEADFRLGDFVPYLLGCADRYDVLIASGVLYHATDPVGLLKSAARVARSICLWTHYYDRDVIAGAEALSGKFDAEPRVERFGAREIVSYKHHYFKALDWRGFCGGPAPFCFWLTRASLLGALEDLGFRIVIGNDERTHPNGPALTLFATRD